MHKGQRQAHRVTGVGPVEELDCVKFAANRPVVCKVAGLQPGDNGKQMLAQGFASEQGVRAFGKGSALGKQPGAQFLARWLQCRSKFDDRRGQFDMPRDVQ